MPVSTQVANNILDQYYPQNQSNIHGRLHVSRLTHLMPVLVDFFKKNIDLVPTNFQNELNNLTDADIALYQEIALHRASGRMNGHTFTDKGRGVDFCDAGAANCEAYLLTKGLNPQKSKALAHAIIEAEKQPSSLLGWVLKHATVLETLRDQKIKTVRMNDLPAFANASPQGQNELTTLATTHYALIVKQQGFACVTLKDNKHSKIYLPKVDVKNIQAGKGTIHVYGTKPTCFTDAGTELRHHYANSRLGAAVTVSPPLPVSSAPAAMFQPSAPSQPAVAQPKAAAQPPKPSVKAYPCDTQDPRLAAASISISNKINASVLQQPGPANNSPNVEKPPIIRKGNLNGTFKVAFDNHADAQKFFAYLKANNIANISYYPRGDRYPMSHGDKVLSNIVRFEVPPGQSIPTQAVDFLKDHLGFTTAQADTLFNDLGMAAQLNIRPKM